MKKFHTIYDRIAKRCLSLSQETTIRLINGLYGTHYPLNSPVSYNWTEHTAEDLRKTLADTIITIGEENSYHVEFQMSDDGDMLFRMFEYGYRHAVTVQNGKMLLHFPTPLILCLYEDAPSPDQMELLVQFGDQGTFKYRVPVVKYQEISREELMRRNLIALTPFQLLKLRKALANKRSPENIAALKRLLSNDIIGSISEALASGMISFSESQKIKLMVQQLYHHLFSKYKEDEMKEINDMADEALILEIDIIEQRHRNELREATEKAARESARQLTAMRLMLKGLSDREISERTGFTPEELESLRSADE